MPADAEILEALADAERAFARLRSLVGIAQLTAGPALRLKEAAAIACVDERTMRRWAEAGLGKKVGGSWRFDRRAVEDFVSRKTG